MSITLNKYGSVWNRQELINRNNNIQIIEDWINGKIDNTAFQEWLNENKFTPGEPVATFADLPTLPQRFEIRLIESENKQYIFNGTAWVVFGAVNADGVTTLKSRVDDIGVSVKDFGAVGDGVVNDTQAFQDAIDQIAGTGVDILIPKGHYKLATLIIDGSKGVSLVGAGIKDTILDLSERFFYTTNTKIFADVTSDELPEGSSVLKVSDASAIETGDLVTVTTTEKMEETSRIVEKSHSALVSRINGNSILLSHGFPTTFNAGIEKQVSVYSTGEITTKGFTVRGNYDGYFADISNTSRFSAKEMKVENRYQGYQGRTSNSDTIGSSGGSMNGFRILLSVSATFERVDFDSVAYGIMPSIGSVGTQIVDCHANNSRHLVAPTGGAQYTLVKDCTTSGCFAGYDSHQTAYLTTHLNCTSFGDKMEVKFRGREDIIENCKFSGGIEVFADSNVVSKKVLRNVDGKGHLRTSATTVVIENVRVFGSTYLFALGKLEVRGLEINKENYDIPSSLPISSEQDYVIRMGYSPITIIEGLEINGPKKGVAGGGGEKSASNLKAIQISYGSDEDIVSLGSAVIDGFDIGIDLPISKNLSRYNLSNVIVRNCVEGIATYANYKEGLDLSSVYLDSCTVDITDPTRLT